MPTATVAQNIAIGVQPSAANTDETLLAKKADSRVGLIGVFATIPSGLTTETAVLKDGTNVLSRLDVNPGQTRALALSLVLPLAGDLVMNATSTDVELTAWAADVL